MADDEGKIQEMGGWGEVETHDKEQLQGEGNL